MFSRFLFVFILSVLIFSSFAIGITGASVIVTSDYNVKHTNIPASIVYQQGSSKAPFDSASINSEGDSATVYLNTSWTSGIYTDDQGNTYWITTSGNVSVYNYPNNESYYLPSIPSYYVFSPFTSVASVNYSNYNYTVLLNEKGYVYGYNGSTRNWFNATKTWSLTLQKYPGPWVSVTSNVMNNFIGGGHESFFFVSYSGAVAAYSVGKSRVGKGAYNIYSTGQDLAFVSSVANWNETSKTSGELYGLEWNGSVYYFKKTWQYWGNVFGSPGSGAVGITIGYDPNNFTQNVFVSVYQNSTPLYESYNQAGAPSSGGFFEAGTPAFRSGNVESLTFDNYDFYNNYETIFYEVETNGTVAASFNLTTWYYADNIIPPTSYSDVVSIAWVGAPNANPWTSYAEIQSYQEPWNSLYFNMSFLSNVIGYQYNYSDNPLFSGSSLSQPVELSHNFTISVDYIGYPNMMGNSTFYFSVIFTYPMNSQPAIVIAYNLQFIVINHFYYMPVG
jgi:hypothetical protein